MVYMIQASPKERNHPMPESTTPSKNACPHCGATNCFDTVAVLNVEAYGSQTFKMKCTQCQNPIRVHLKRKVVLDSIEKGLITDEPHF